MQNNQLLLKQWIFNGTKCITCFVLACMERFESQPLTGSCANSSVYGGDKLLGFRHTSVWLRGCFCFSALKAFPQSSRILVCSTAGAIKTYVPITDRNVFK